MSPQPTHSSTDPLSSPVMLIVVIAVIAYFVWTQWEQFAGSTANQALPGNTVNANNPSSVAAPGTTSTAPTSTQPNLLNPDQALLTPMFTLQDILQAAGHIATHATAATTSTATPNTAVPATTTGN